jgi:hypothetical protein
VAEGDQIQHLAGSGDMASLVEHATIENIRWLVEEDTGYL